jgi:hypothetical protein
MKREDNVLCCPTCGHPKPEVNPSDAAYLGWPACQNEACVAYGEAMASCWYRTRGDLRDDGIVLPPRSRDENDRN